MSLELVEELHYKLYEFYSDHKYIEPCKQSQFRYNFFCKKLNELDRILDELYIPGKLLIKTKQLNQICDQLLNHLIRKRCIYPWEFEIYNDIHQLLQDIKSFNQEK
ncbi:MAG: 40S ribosomal protein S18-A [Cressdnaviricota sp.]|nr:MAG: 40S ribosomal protein S18-A [Cressdnaviricota sp.]